MLGLVGTAALALALAVTFVPQHTGYESLWTYRDTTDVLAMPDDAPQRCRDWFSQFPRDYDAECAPLQYVVAPDSPAPFSSEAISINGVPFAGAMLLLITGVALLIAAAASPGTLTPKPTPAPARPIWRFNSPPGWPEAPAGWLPPAGWKPDATWPSAPADWQWYTNISEPTEATSATTPLSAELARLNDLRTSGALTEDEFTAAKARLLRP